MKVKSQSGPVELQPNDAPYKLNAKQPVMPLSPSEISPVEPSKGVSGPACVLLPSVLKKGMNSRRRGLDEGT